ncbi:MAG: bifunctional diaminohydroxyphosphoribosylaminopyrimidine deaminase/5-amino-6-(5-phosphoribosylamino)uracil reductase RibD [Vicinamibacterales bacterium]
MVDARDAAMMARARFLAERGRGTTSPNPIVGAVVVDRDGVIVGQGAHRQAGGPHAEVVALDEAGARARGATLYVTLEPCCHTGRTGPCAARIVSDGIARVVLAVRDPNPRVDGGGVRFLRAHGVEVVEGVGEEEARYQNAPFFTWMARKRPHVTLKAAVSADGFVGRPGQRVQITGAEARRYFHRERAEVDAIAVGAGTVVTDDPWLTARGAWRARPLVRVLFDWSLRIRPSARVFSTLAEGPVIMMVSRAATEARPDAVIALERRGVSIERRDDRALGPMLRWLAARDVVSLLIEGGPTLQQAFWEAGAVDRSQVVVAPTVLGDGLPIAAGFGGEHGWRRRDPVRQLGADRFIEWDVHGTD